MSYFFAGANVLPARISALENSFSEVISWPIKTRTDIRDAKSFLTNYEQPKIVTDTIIHSPPSSWIAITGTPLVTLNKESEKEAFATRFFAAPDKTISKEIDGHFAIVAFDAAKNIFYAATDYNCFIPIFYAVTAQGVVFSSSELVLAKILHAAPELSGVAQAIYLGATLGDGTRFEGIKKLQPCELISVSIKGDVHTRYYWTPQDESQWHGNFDQVLERWLPLLKVTLREYINRLGSTTLSTDFTAGEDSRLIVALAHNYGIPFCSRVVGYPGDVDVEVASRAANRGGFDLSVEYLQSVEDEDLLSRAGDICLRTDGYGSFLYFCKKFVTENRIPPKEFERIHLSGFAGGNVLRGEYYLRAKLLFPSNSKLIDHKFFANMRLLLGFEPGLVNIDDYFFKHQVLCHVEKALEDVTHLPAGIKVDHLMRSMENCLFGLHTKRPFYFPYAIRDTTRSIYNLPAHMKQGGKLAKAATEILFPRLAFAKTQKSVPTIRKTVNRMHLFLPEYYSIVRKATNGLARHFFPHSKVGQSSKAHSAYHYRVDYHRSAIENLFKHKPYSDWSSNSMLTGEFYNPKRINAILDDVRQGNIGKVETLGRIINQELSFRYVYG